MSRGLLFWVIMIICLLMLIGANWPGVTNRWIGIGNSIIIWILLALLGWNVFGPMLH